MKYDVFISYSRKDKSQVLSFAEKLKAAGYSVWIDYEGIHSSEDFKCRIVEAINDSLCFIFFSSVNANKSQYTIREVGVAVQLKKHIIPIKLDDAPYANSILFDLVNIDYIDATQHDSEYIFRRVTDVLALCRENRQGKTLSKASVNTNIGARRRVSPFYFLFLLFIIGCAATIVFFLWQEKRPFNSTILTDTFTLPETDTCLATEPSPVITMPTPQQLAPISHIKEESPKIDITSQYCRMIEEFQGLVRNNPSTENLLKAKGVISQMETFENNHPEIKNISKTGELNEMLNKELKKKSDEYVRYAYDNCFPAQNDSAAEVACRKARQLLYTDNVKQLESDIRSRRLNLNP